MSAQLGVSFVVPVHNGARWLGAALTAIRAQADGRPFEIWVVDDDSTDGSAQLAAGFEGVTVIPGEGRGAAAAINAGIRHARHPVICQVDQDVVLHPGWMSRLLGVLEADPTVGAVQGRYQPTGAGSPWSRVMALDLDDRYHQIPGSSVDHTCTGNSAYRAQALRDVGLFDEAFGYAYDNDLSYRLGAAGHGLRFCREATSTHHWREGLGDYLRQQYGVGYGRLELVLKHRRRARGDQVSGPGMIIHAGVMFGAVCALPLGLIWLGPIGALPSLCAVLGLGLERAWAGARIWRRTGDRAAWLFPLAHLLRDLAWAGAIGVWAAHRIGRSPHQPSASMNRMAAK